jgi:hypothetical protein
MALHEASCSNSAHESRPGPRARVPGQITAKLARVPAPANAGHMDRILAMLGRAPDWSPPAGWWLRQFHQPEGYRVSSR